MCFSFPKISALVVEGISSGKSSGLDYPEVQKWKSQWSWLVLSSINPTTPDAVPGTGSAPCVSRCKTRGVFTKITWSRSELGVLFVSYQLRWGFPEEPMNRGLNFLKTLLFIKAFQIRFNSLSFVLIPSAWRREAYPRSRAARRAPRIAASPGSPFQGTPPDHLCSRLTRFRNVQS